MHLVNTYRLDKSGLKLTYTKDAHTHRLQLDPPKVAKLLEDLKLKHDRWAWEEVVKQFAIDTHLPGRIAEHHSRYHRTYERYTGAI